VNEIDNVYLFNIDNLEQIVQQNVVDREREVARCMPLVDEETLTFWKEMTPPDVTVLLTQIRERLHAIRGGGAQADPREAQRPLRHPETGGPGPSPAHCKQNPPSPSEALRSAGADSSSRSIIELVRKLFESQVTKRSKRHPP
jgi:glutamyl-tRNA reductase